MPILMKFDGIDGSVTSAGYEKHILLESCEWGVERNVETVGGITHNRARPTFHNVTFVKMGDDVSVLLANNCFTNKDTKTVVINWVRTNKSGDLQTFFRLELDGAAVISYKLMHGADRPVDHFSLAYRKLEIKAWSWLNDRAGTARSAAYDLEGGK